MDAKQLGKQAVHSMAPIYGDNGHGMKVMEEQGNEGMTLRQHYAGLALQGLLAYPGSSGNPGDQARAAVACADALLAELVKP